MIPENPDPLPDREAIWFLNFILISSFPWRSWRLGG